MFINFVFKKPSLIIDTSLINIVVSWYFGLYNNWYSWEMWSNTEMRNGFLFLESVFQIVQKIKLNSFDLFWKQLLLISFINLSFFSFVNPAISVIILIKLVKSEWSKCIAKDWIFSFNCFEWSFSSVFEIIIFNMLEISSIIVKVFWGNGWIYFRKALWIF